MVFRHIERRLLQSFEKQNFFATLITPQPAGAISNLYEKLSDANLRKII